MKIAVREGPEGRIREIRFAGNAGIRSKDLRKQMTSTEKGPLSFLTGSGRYREDEWNADLAAVVGLYQKDGFARARIVSVKSDWDDAGGITQTIRIDAREPAPALCAWSARPNAARRTPCAAAWSPVRGG